MNYCCRCGGPVKQEIPDNDDRLRDVCTICMTVYYQNPKVVAGAIAVWDGKILLCRRAIEPAYGKWTLPAGYLENGETVAECAVRETREEAGVELTDLIPYAMISLPDIRQVYFIYCANLVDGVYQAGAESLEVSLVDPAAIPWDELAFSSIRKTLELYCQDEQGQRFSGQLHDIVLRKV